MSYLYSNIQSYIQQFDSLSNIYQQEETLLTKEENLLSIKSQALSDKINQLTFQFFARPNACVDFYGSASYPNTSTLSDLEQEETQLEEQKAAFLTKRQLQIQRRDQLHECYQTLMSFLKDEMRKIKEENPLTTDEEIIEQFQSYTELEELQASLKTLSI